MITVSISEAKNRLSALLDKVRQRLDQSGPGLIHAEGIIAEESQNLIGLPLLPRSVRAIAWSVNYRSLWERHEAAMKFASRNPIL